MLMSATNPSASTGRVRNATLLDLPEISRLITNASPKQTLAQFDSGDLFEHGYALVLELAPDHLGAVVHVEVDATHHATIDLMVIDPELPPLDTELRMSGVAHALCEAYGCNCDTIAPRQRFRGRR
ncbi:MAG: hypothetical protein HOV81_17595 [Kofleriaceae bacterium]|nr:hypothetical protein [Kofleriaceae bacterium]